MTECLARDFPGTPLGPDRDAVVERMRAEFFGARRAGRGSSALSVTLENAKRLQSVGGDELERQALSAVADWLREVLHGRDLLGFAEERRLVLFLPDTDLAAAEAAAAHAISRGRNDGIACGERVLPVRMAVGVADGARREVRFVETLLAVAAEGASVAGAGGGSRWVHTELYETVQARLERELPEEAKRPPAEPEPVAVAAGPAPNGSAPAEADEVEETAEALEEAFALPADLEETLFDELTAVAVGDEAPEVAAEPSEAEREQLVDLALDRARREWVENAMQLSAKHAREIERLERRIAKLNSALEGAEESVERYRQAGVPEPGVASAFRHVQGLSWDSDHFELKRELMGMIFQANLDLRRELGHG